TKVGLIAIIPNIFPIIITFGIMGWFGIHLSMVTSLIASIAIGLAVDDTIHYLFRYNREFKIDLDKDRSMADSIRYVGKPVLITTITIGLGFAVLLFSSFKPTAVFGLLMVITMLSAVIGDLIILPSLMLNVELVTAWDLLKLMPTLSGISNAAAHELNQPLNVIKMGSDYLNMIAQ
ncbi:MAG: MMPL family transporter, partial [Planctomycetes bacterium]|nr:MMPL family transporter [Planctomycetota bacterium]